MVCLHIHDIVGPDAAPVIIEAFSPSSTSLYLSWDPLPPELHRGILTGYRVTYKIVAMDRSVQITTNTSITLEDLNAFTSYQVSVSAGTVVGYSPEDTINIMTLDDSKTQCIFERSVAQLVVCKCNNINALLCHFIAYRISADSYTVVCDQCYLS